ncbi:pyruvate dehydrogenase [acetyl-transferring]-phosphatase 1, mitochondrial isoform X1 [Drosophila teissieri]|uniref:pyruvate dehydrogenase [acetyl-transferring]-phosphatase 1, mitochondrial isoform X1 n=1 Tax=Drosophila teissieri TaxID=7243 RepID=UPI001CBA2FE7|nr:pyruvate dehydrogenase [acetyl-transferring]-phosphatase 1, mitochondrial isoform X1 [Drosophila teissieri]XP_043659836.1 pyruvate dehydrogenase [acetyl-transferring]-phosphatase 1, mitochondrial isoform X1 [Drosophila teissieri]
MFKFVLHDAATYVRSNVREFSLNALRLLPQLPQLSPYDVNLVLRENEFVYNFPVDGVIRSYETNQLGSNSPCEDSRTEASLLHRNGFICGIFDGHAGAACGQVVSKRLLRYVSAATLPRQVLQEQMKQGADSQSFLKCHNDNVDFVSEIKPIYEASFLKYIKQLTETPQRDVSSELINAFLQLDNGLSQEALASSDVRTMSVALSGAVACLVHIEGLQMHVASTGDCGAVLGVLDPQTQQWQPKKLNIEHNADNMSEVRRILAEHPKEEQETVIRNGRLLSQLAPLRAFGDFRYKWSLDIMQQKVLPMFGEQAMAPNYYTPPYLTARPDVQQHELGPNDKFLVIASDGLWDFLSPSEVVSLVGEHINSKKILEPMRLPEGDTTLQQISDQLAERKAGLTRKPVDQNAATHLIRHALGATDYGIEHSKISYYLTLPKDVVRLYRDDITITVIYFNSEHIAQLHTEVDQTGVTAPVA